MKKCVWVFLLMICVSFFSKAQSFEVQQLLLDVQKLSQLKQMLSDLKKGYEIVYRGYSAIKEISEGNFSLHRSFLDGLLKVSPAVKNYRKVAAIIEAQMKILSEYKTAMRRFRLYGSFTPQEIDYMQKVYSNLLRESLKSLETLSMIISPGVLRMSDEERLKQVDLVYQDLMDKLTFLRHFTTQCSLLSLQRRADERDINLSKKIFGLTN